MKRVSEKPNVSGKKVLVAGLARSGVCAANLLLGMGAKVSVTDSRSNEELKDSLKSLKAEPEIYTGGHDSVPLVGLTLAVISPGIPWNSPFLKRMRSFGVRLTSEIELAAGYIDIPLIAVTGTNGKTTTTTLISEILKAAGSRVFTGGNIGTPLCEYVNSGVDAEYVVCEVSSFQLEGVTAFRPDVSVILNITEDHLDRHADMKEYAGLKERIFMNQGEGDILILNGDDPALCDLVIPDGVCVRRFSRRKKVENGAWFLGGSLFLNENGKTGRVCGSEDIPLVGGHNLENVMAAVLACRASGAGYIDILNGIKKFRSIEHRMEVVGVVDGVTYINDSKGTNVSAAEKSIESFEAPVILIAGGKDKGGDYTPLIGAIMERVKYLVLLGEAGGKISAMLKGYESKSTAVSMEDAVLKASSRACSGDIVLLSPACSSFDMFSSYEERGEVFKDAVSRLNGLKSYSVARDA